MHEFVSSNSPSFGLFVSYGVLPAWPLCVQEKKAADEHRQALRARAGQYRQDKELAKTSAFAR